MRTRKCGAFGGLVRLPRGAVCEGSELYTMSVPNEHRKDYLNHVEFLEGVSMAKSIKGKGT